VRGVVEADGGSEDDFFDIGNARVLSDAVRGGAGNDTMRVGNAVTFDAPVFDFGKQDLEILVPDAAIVGFGGVSHKFNFFKAELASGYTGAAIFGDSQTDTLIGTRGNDTLSGSGGADEINTGGGADSVFGGAGDDKTTIRPVMGMANDGLLINGEAGSDTVDWHNFRLAIRFDLSDGAQQDTGVGTVTATNVENLIGGLRGDTFIGNALGNVFFGGRGSDTMTGGLGLDRYVFDDGDSLASRPDLVTDLADGDTIDLSLIDADHTTAGNQAFVLGDSSFSGVPGDAYMEHFDALLGRTRFLMDVDGDGEADYTVHFTGNHEDHDDFVM
jgi:Ca2+-binding RTX toxin-like protein